ncbi:MAG: hopanoid biosynthesis-associated protein HpnK [Pseudolabrys sp.]
MTADDFGLAAEVNDAVEMAHAKGVLTAASLMVAGPAAAQAVAMAKRLPRLRVGLHLTLLEGPPAAPRQEIPDLIDADGNLRGDMVALSFELLRPSLRRQLRREIAAQFEAFRKTGLALDHVNAHKHFHVHPLVAREVLDSARENGAPALRVPSEPGSVLAQVEGARQPSQGIMAPWTRLLRARARRAGLMTSDAVFGLRWTGQMTAERLTGLLAHLPAGLTEIYTHPATADWFAGHAPGCRYAAELAALTDPTVIEVVGRSAHRTGGFADFDTTTSAAA